VVVLGAIGCPPKALDQLSGVPFPSFAIMKLCPLENDERARLFSSTLIAIFLRLLGVSFPTSETPARREADRQY